MITEYACQPASNLMRAEYLIEGGTVTKTKLQFVTRGAYCMTFHDAITGETVVSRRMAVSGSVVTINPPHTPGYITVEECCE